MSSRGRHLRYLATCAGLVALCLFLALPGTASAHATLGSTDPPANEIVSSSPGRVELRFTEPVEEAYTAVILVDQTGAEVPDTSFQIDSSDATLIHFDIPDELPRGTYSVVWRTLSAADGHRFSGYFAFTVGSTADVRTVIPPTFDAQSGAPFWLNVASRWFVFLTLSALAGLWFAWVLVIRPGLRPVWQIAPTLVPKIRRFALLAGLMYLLGSALALLIQIWGQSDGDPLGTIRETLMETRWGSLWILRIIFGATATLVFAVAPWWWPRRNRLLTGLLFLISLLLVLPHALISHASAQRFGRTEAIAADYYHLLAMSIWFGGLILIAVTMFASGDLLPGGRRAFLVRMIPGFSIVAIVCWASLGLSGVYSGYLQVGSWSALTDTDYGRSLIFKLIALAIVLVVASINLLVVTRHINRSESDSGSLWWRRFGVLLGIEIVGVAIALIFVGRMTAMEPGRQVVAELENQQTIALTLDDRSSTLTIAPGSAGPNHFRLDIGGGTSGRKRQSDHLAPTAARHGRRQADHARAHNRKRIRSAFSGNERDWRLDHEYHGQPGRLVPMAGRRHIHGASPKGWGSLIQLPILDH